MRLAVEAGYKPVERGAISRPASTQGFLAPQACPELS
jgi:hypothetical protein